MKKLSMSLVKKSKKKNYDFWLLGRKQLKYILEAIVINVLIWSLLLFKKPIFCNPNKTVYTDMVVSKNLEVIQPKYPIGDDVVFILDLDDTLVHSGTGLSRAEMLYLNDIFHIEIEKMERVPKVTFMESLQTINLYTNTFLENGFTSEQFWRWSDSFPFTEYVKRDEETINFLKWLKKHVRICGFTNSEIFRASVVLKSLGVDGLLETVVTTTRRDTVIIHKPMPESFSFVDCVLKISDKRKVYFFDDSELNVELARAHGWNAYHTPKHSNLTDVINLALRDANIITGQYDGLSSMYLKQEAKLSEKVLAY